MIIFDIKFSKAEHIHPNWTYIFSFSEHINELAVSVRRKKQKIKHMTLDELKIEVVYSENSTRLYEMMIEITEKISKFHIELAKSDDNIRKVEIKGQISVYNTLLTIIDKRIDDIRVLNSEQERKEFYINRQFKMAAEVVLQKETFARIKELSIINYKNFKDQKAELKNSKLE